MKTCMERNEEQETKWINKTQPWSFLGGGVKNIYKIKTYHRNNPNDGRER